MILVAGVDKAVNNIRKAAMDHAVKPTRRGLISAGLWIMRESIKITPRDLGNLWHSAYVVWTGKHQDGGEGFFGKQASTLQSLHESAKSKAAGMAAAGGAKNPAVVIGFSAFYALYVHEDLEASHTKEVKAADGGTTTAELGEAKFLEKTLNRTSEITGIIVGGATQ